MPFSEDELNSAHLQSIGRLFLQAQRDFQARLVKKLQVSGSATAISPAHMMALSQFARGSLRVVDLAERMKITKQSASDVVRDLEALGYVERTPDPRDKRAALIGFTEAGEAFLHDKLHIAEEINQEYTAILGREGFEELTRLLTRLLRQDES